MRKSVNIDYDETNKSHHVYFVKLIYPTKVKIEPYAFVTHLEAMHNYSHVVKEWTNERGVWIGHFRDKKKPVFRDAVQIEIHCLLLMVES